MEMPRRERTWLIAASLTVFVHAGLAAWLLQRPDAPRPAAEPALQVVWIDRPSPPPPSPAPPAPDLPGPTTPAATRPPVARATPPRPSTALQAVELPAAAAPMPAAALQEQARQFARGQLPAGAFDQDPLRHRPAARADGRFAVREPVSPEDVVIAIGTLFGGGPTDPCPRIRRNLANADMAEGRELAEEEIRRLRRNCL